MSEPANLLEIPLEKNEHGFYTVLWYGREYALTEYPRVQYSNGYSRDAYISFAMREIPSKPKPKRRRQSDLGLRKPGGAR